MSLYFWFNILQNKNTKLRKEIENINQELIQSEVSFFFILHWQNNFFAHKKQQNV